MSNKSLEISRLKNELERYRFMVENASDCISIHSPDEGWSYLYVNQTITSFSGYTPEEVLGRSAYEHFHPDDVERFKNRSADILYRGEVSNARYRSIHKDGRVMWVECTRRAVRNAETGVLEMILCVSRDITSRIEADRQIRDWRAELAQAGRLMSLGQASTGVAHEINQPLAAILNYAKGALRQIKDGRLVEASSLIQVFENIVKQSQRTSEILKRIRSLVKKAPYHASRFSINHLCHEVVAHMRSEIEDQGIHIKLALCEDEPIVEGDTVQLEQVLVNLLRNALEAFQLTEKDYRLVELSSFCDDNLVVLKVTDYADGIANDRLGKIFETFYTSKKKGLGMGLSIAHSIMEAHGGVIEADSDGNSYACFTIKLPLCKGE
jgi:PAS domain S-box-containing protein